jgi:hypothetical protein
VKASARAGFTLVELCAALGCLVAVATLATQIMVTQTRLALIQEAGSGVGADLRTGVAFLGREWRDLVPGRAEGDLVSVGSSEITYRAFRASALACDLTARQVLLRMAPWYGYRQLAPDRDSLLLFVEGDSLLSRDDRWVPLPVLSVSSGTCGSVPAFAVGTMLDSALTADVRFDAPVRTFEVVQVRSYPQGFQLWLGARSVTAGESIQPLLGPLPAPGLALEYLDGWGRPTGTSDAIRQIVARLAVGPDRQVQAAVGAASRPLDDSVTVVVTLRSASR